MTSHGMAAHDPWHNAEVEDENRDQVAHAGAPLPVGTPVATPDAVMNALRTVFDPEIPVNIVELGLIYDLKVDPDGTTTVNMTLTAPACPVAGEMPEQVAEAAASVSGVGEVTVHLVWDPPWSQDRMSEVARLELGLL
ncbi:MAG: DUF59 domain-containing protein [Alphaproteobacteria bacterium]